MLYRHWMAVELAAAVYRFELWLVVGEVPLMFGEPTLRLVVINRRVSPAPILEFCLGKQAERLATASRLRAASSSQKRFTDGADK
jgi:hypothetical protein